MPRYEYKVVPAPRKGEKARGVRTVEERFALALANLMNLWGRDGWQFVRTDTLPVEEKAGWTRRASTSYLTMLVFCRQVDEADEAPRGLRLQVRRDPETRPAEAPVPEPVPLKAPETGSRPARVPEPPRPAPRPLRPAEAPRAAPAAGPAVPPVRPEPQLLRPLPPEPDSGADDGREPTLVPLRREPPGPGPRPPRLGPAQGE